jgi:hypothetical protein
MSGERQLGLGKTNCAGWVCFFPFGAKKFCLPALQGARLEHMRLLGFSSLTPLSFFLSVHPSRLTMVRYSFHYLRCFNSKYSLHQQAM